jgi:hypothetical protein
MVNASAVDPKRLLVNANIASITPIFFSATGANLIELSENNAGLAGKIDEYTMV